MTVALLMLAALLAGLVLPVQVGLNNELKAHAGRAEWASMVSFTVGAVTMAIYNLVARVPWPGGAAVAGAPWWAWIGGALGAVYVTSSILITPRLGFGTTTALIVGGQMIAALFLDHYGALGAARHEMNLVRLGGAALVVVGVVLMRRF